MIQDWGAHLGGKRKIVESAAWLLAGSAVALSIAASAALATWFDRREGDGVAQTILIDLPPLDAVADAPALQPEASTLSPESADIPDADSPPDPLADLQDLPPAPEQPLLPAPEALAEALPDTTPPPEPEPEPEPEPVKPPEVVLPKPKPKTEAPKEPREKPVQKAERKAEKKAADPPAEKPRKTRSEPPSQASQAASAAAGAAAGSASPSEMAKWKSRVQQVLAKHMRRKSYGYRGNVTLVIHTTPAGQIAKVELSSSTGNTAADAALRDHAARAKLPPSPRALAEVLTLPVSLR